jgi:hypothetical protein
MRLSKIQMMTLHFFVTSIFFYFEALMHYNIGKKGKIDIEIPEIKHNKKIVMIILIFSLLSSLACYFIEEIIHYK